MVKDFKIPEKQIIALDKEPVQRANWSEDKELELRNEGVKGGEDNKGVHREHKGDVVKPKERRGEMHRESGEGGEASVRVS